MIVAVDGPATAGKGTLARRLAQHFGLAYLDTGSLYRAAALRVLRAGADPADESAAEAAARAIGTAALGDPALRDEATGEAASVLAANPRVRAALLAFQREFARNPPGGVRGAVVDGRDIGTVVLPDAGYKLFVTASVEERARRRYGELVERGEAPELAHILRQMAERDRRDTGRAASPLLPAADAFLLDTTELDIDAAFAAASAYISGSTR